MTTLDFFSALATPAGIFPMREALSLGDSSDDVFRMSNDQLTSAAKHLRDLAKILDGLRIRYHLLYRGRGDWSMFSGTDAELAQELRFRNEHVHLGLSVVEMSFDTEEECREDLEMQKQFFSDAEGNFCKTVIIQLEQERGIEVTSKANDTPHQ